MPFIGLIIRGKYSEAHEPDLMAQHADVILSTGAPNGFFGEGEPLSGVPGMLMEGRVYDYAEMAVQRPYYVFKEEAKRRGVVSTYCSLHVSTEKAKRFDAFWSELHRRALGKKENFTLIGDNCSTHASEGFVAAGILDVSIPGLDTPDNLFKQLKTRYGGSFRCQSGYIGVERNGMRFNLTVDRLPQRGAN